MKIGKLLRSTRIYKGISQQALCSGICTVSALSKYESEERVPDSLLFSLFLQRMGKTADNFAFMISAEEYEYYQWKKETLEAVHRREWKKLEKLVCTYDEKNFSCNENLQKQYLLYLESLVQEKRYGEIDRAMNLLRSAVLCTIPDFEAEGWTKERRMGVSEINLIIFYVKKSVSYGKMTPQTAEKIFRELLQYLHTVNLDEQEAVKIVPRLICLLVETAGENMRPKERMNQAKEALNLLTRSGFLYHLPEILLLLEKEPENEQSGEAAIYRKWRETLCGIMEEYGKSAVFDDTELYDYGKNLFLVGEILYNYRQHNGLTQEKASEEICAVETYSRIENGRQSPSMKHYRALEKKLRIGWGYYQCDLEVEDYRLLEIRNKVQSSIYYQNWEEALAGLCELKEEMDMTNPVNLQYIRMAEALIQYYRGEIAVGEWYEKAVAALELTRPDFKQKVEFVTFSKHELLLVNHIAIALGEMGKTESGIELYEKVIQSFKNSRQSMESNWNKLELIFQNCGFMLAKQKRREESLEICEMCIQKAISTNYGSEIGKLLMSKSVNLKILGLADDLRCQHIYEQAFYFTDLFHNKESNASIRESYEKIHGVKKWY